MISGLQNTIKEKLEALNKVKVAFNIGKKCTYKVLRMAKIDNKDSDYLVLEAID